IPKKTGSHATRRWREMDSNVRSPVSELRGRPFPARASAPPVYDEARAQPMAGRGGADGGDSGRGVGRAVDNAGGSRRLAGAAPRGGRAGGGAEGARDR